MPSAAAAPHSTSLGLIRRRRVRHARPPPAAARPHRAPSPRHARRRRRHIDAAVHGQPTSVARAVDANGDARRRDRALPCRHGAGRGAMATIHQRCRRRHGNRRFRARARGRQGARAAARPPPVHGPLHEYQRRGRAAGEGVGELVPRARRMCNARNMLCLTEQVDLRLRGEGFQPAPTASAATGARAPSTYQPSAPTTRACTTHRRRRARGSTARCRRAPLLAAACRPRASDMTGNVDSGWSTRDGVPFSNSALKGGWWGRFARGADRRRRPWRGFVHLLPVGFRCCRRPAVGSRT